MEDVKKHWLLLGILACTSLWIVAPAGKIALLYEELLNARQAVLSGGNSDLGDFFYPWYGSRELIVHHRDPYATAVTQEIRTAKKLEYAKDEREGQFVYPLHVALLILPLLWLPYQTARLIFFGFLLFALVVSIRFWFQFVRLKLSLPALLLTSALILLSPPTVYGLLETQVTVLVAALIASCAAALASEHFLLAGCLLALASIRPQMIILLVPWLLLWTAGQWRVRRNFAFGLLGGLVTLLVVAELLLPGWPAEWMNAVNGYRAYAGDTIMELMVGRTLGLWFSWGFIAWLFFALREVQKESPGSEKFAIGFSLILIAELVVCPGMIFGYNQILLIPAVLLLLTRQPPKPAELVPVT